MAQDFSLQGVLATEERSGHYARGSMCALKGKRQAKACPAPSVPGCHQNRSNKALKINGLFKLASGLVRNAG